ncbi:polyprenyl synthetase family protein [Lacrimispora sp. NSJ-141]|uniref:Farnesyl diphosphate synthase n=1 Tax=Lientehia hominis TaxID=2897778 RepID=A0AAP2RIZ7_9FIRM|nr:farnesyl diphosphate synthase [Lientehia hominis]MCD2492621.1 polyprenyl synthetase family protein [Lientehia hominis]
MNFKEEMNKKVEDIERMIRAYLPKEKGFQKTILEAMNYSVLAGGKRLRPLLMQESFRLFGRKGDEIAPFMAAIEMIHTSSLVHDDLPAMDADEYRRGRKTTWVVYGEDMAILAGDALMIYAFETASKAFGQTDRPDLAGRCIGILAEKTGIYGMIGGQTVDVEMTGEPVPADKLDFIYRLKTGALLEASMMIGAVLGGASLEEVKQIEQVASDVGLAFQIQDDILDVISSKEVLGKPVLSDEKNHKTTYVTLEGLDKAREQVEFYSRRAVDTLNGLSRKNEFLNQLILTLITREK